MLQKLRDNVNARVERTRTFVRDNAATFIIAGATTVTAVQTIRTNRFMRGVLKATVEGKRASAAEIERCVAEGESFKYYPGLGVLTDTEKKILKASNRK